MLHYCAMTSVMFTPVYVTLLYYDQCNGYPLCMLHYCAVTSVMVTPCVCYTQPISMSEEPNAVIDCYLAISLDSLVFICEHSKVLYLCVFNDIAV